MPKQPKDLTGQRFGRLVAQEVVGRNANGESLWRCLCDCKNEKVVASSVLTKGESTSCGCLRKELAAALSAAINARKDLTGKRFGKFVVTGPSAEATDGQSRIWNLRCDCGGTHAASTRDLAVGAVRSCGCLRTPTRPNRRSLVGEEFGPFAVTGLHPERDKFGSRVWEVACKECGGTARYTTADLTKVTGWNARICRHCGSKGGDLPMRTE
jgi:hypothetical protein